MDKSTQHFKFIKVQKAFRINASENFLLIFCTDTVVRVRLTLEVTDLLFGQFKLKLNGQNARPVETY